MSDRLVHGGRLDAAVAEYGGQRDDWLDLSTGINPQSYPVPELHASVWHRLPDTADYEAARNALRGAYGVAEDAAISLASGSQMHIQLLPLLLKPQDVSVVGFTYAEHAQAWRRGGHNVFVSDGLASAEASARIVVVVNPNNPDGTLFSADELKALSRRLAAKGGLLVVDEAFGDVTPDASVLAATGREGLIVLRSLGKFYGLAGTRFGAMVGAGPLIGRMDDLLGPWAVSGPALTVAAAAFGDKTWRRKAATKLHANRLRLEADLQQAGLELMGATDLFVLAEHLDAQAIDEKLKHARILVRTFPEQSLWLRFGIPGNSRHAKRLAKALADR